VGLSEGALPVAEEATERNGSGRQMRKALAPTKMSGTATGAIHQQREAMLFS